MAAKREIARRLGRARLSEGRGSNGLVAPTGERGRKSFGLHRPWTFSSTGTGLGVSRPRPGHGSRRVQDLNARRSDAATVLASPTRTARCLNASGHMAQRARCTVADMVLCAIYGGQSLVGKKEEKGTAVHVIRSLVDALQLAWGKRVGARIVLLISCMFQLRSRFLSIIAMGRPMNSSDDWAGVARPATSSRAAAGSANGLYQQIPRCPQIRGSEQRPSNRAPLCKARQFLGRPGTLTCP